MILKPKPRGPAPEVAGVSPGMIDTLRAIAQFVDEHRRSPKQEELGLMMGCAGWTAGRHVHKLRKCGLLRKAKRQSRYSIWLTDAGKELLAEEIFERRMGRPDELKPWTYRKPKGE